MIYEQTHFLPPFNTFNPQIGWRWVNKERKIKTRADKEFQIFEELLRKSNFFLEANKEFAQSTNTNTSIAAKVLCGTRDTLRG
jgi:hypothetical protein